MDKEEKLAGLCMIQDDAIDEHNNYLAEKGVLDNLIKSINQDVKHLKKTLKFDKGAKSGKLSQTLLKSEGKSKKNQKKSNGQIQAGGSIITGTDGVFIDVPDIDIGDSSDFDRDSVYATSVSGASDDKRSRRSKARAN